MPQSFWKTLAGCVVLAFLIASFCITVFSNKALADGPGYTPCSTTTWITQATRYGSSSGVSLTGIIRGLMDARDNAPYCGEVVTWATVTTTHTGDLVANLTYKNTIDCRVPNACSKVGTNTYRNYGDPAAVSDGVNQCASDIFYDDNGNNADAYPCWTTP